MSKYKETFFADLGLVLRIQADCQGFALLIKNRGSLPPKHFPVYYRFVHIYAVIFNSEFFRLFNFVDIFRTDSQDHVSAVISVCDLFSSGAIQINFFSQFLHHPEEGLYGCFLLLSLYTGKSSWTGNQGSLLQKRFTGLS